MKSRKQKAENVGCHGQRPQGVGRALHQGAMGNGFALPVPLHSGRREPAHGQAQGGLPMAPDSAKFTALGATASDRRESAVPVVARLPARPTALAVAPDHAKSQQPKANSPLSLPLCVLCVLCGFFSRGASAQSRQIPAPPQERPVVIHSVAVHTVSGEDLDPGYVVFDKGIITAIGRGSPPKLSSADVFDARGMHLYPGLIAADTTLGLAETQSIKETIDTTELGTVRPEVRAAVAINPDSDLIPVARANGILTAGLFPRGGAICGQCATIRLDGWTWEDMTINAAAGLVIDWPKTEVLEAWWIDKTEEEQRKENAENLEALSKVFDDALAYLAARDADPKTPVDLRFESMRAAMTGQTPVFVRASTAGQIESAIAWSVRYKVRLVIVGGEQADQCIALLVKHEVPVIIGGTLRLPMRRQDAYDQPFALPAALRAAGVRFAIASGEEPAHERNLSYHAAAAAAHGLPRLEAIRAVTLYPAQLLGLAEKLGSIEVGKSATLILTNGDPLEITTDTLAAWIDGRQIDLGNRQKSLEAKYREKYRQLGLLKK